MESMDEANRRDMREERLLRDAIRGLDELRICSRLSDAELDRIQVIKDLLRTRADHIVAVWD